MTSSEANSRPPDTGLSPQSSFATYESLQRPLRRSVSALSTSAAGHNPALLRNNRGVQQSTPPTRHLSISTFDSKPALVGTVSEDEALRRVSAPSLHRRLSCSLVSDFPTLKRTNSETFSSLLGVQDLTAKLREHVLFQKASQPFILHVASNFKAKIFKPADPPILRFGEAGRSMYFIYKGTVEIVSEDGETVWARLSDGQFFGETALLLNTKRVTTVRALTKCIIFGLSKEGLEESFAAFPEGSAAIKKDFETRFSKFRQYQLPSHISEQQFLNDTTVMKRFYMEPIAESDDTNEGPPSRKTSLQNGTASGPALSVHSATSENLSDQYTTGSPAKKARRESAQEITCATEVTTKPYLHNVTPFPDTDKTHTSTQISPITSSESPPTVPPHTEKRQAAQNETQNTAIQEQSNNISSCEKSDEQVIGPAKMPETPLVNPTVDLFRRQAGRKRAGSVAVWDQAAIEEMKKLDTAVKVSLPISTLPTETEQKEHTWGTLDENLLRRVFHHLPAHTRWLVGGVCRHWAAAASHESLWEHVDLTSVGKRLTDSMLETVLAKHAAIIKTLDLANCYRLTDNALRTVAQRCPGLRGINCYNIWTLTDAGIVALAEGCRHLESLNVGHCKKITDTSVCQLANLCTGLMSLNLTYCKNLTATSLHYVLARLRMLRSLVLVRCTGITNDAFKLFQDNKAYELEHLVLADLFYLDDAALECIVANTPILKTLNLGFCSGLTEGALGVVGRHCVQLRHLDMSSCSNAVSDTGVAMLLAEENGACASLHSVVFKSNARLTDDAVTQLDQACPHLNYLNVSSCKNVTEKTTHNCRNIREILVGPSKRVKVDVSPLKR
eukprot:comp19652_c1_seq1/m.23252 comp19652_c1_seq1/g.23252  ORF comp19652_c1_seq1/g.23252 comp19652_c1_seq1/m.23252 type:complete len:843 (-) comp19652_c1_seq1:706-3234(-)